MIRLLRVWVPVPPIGKGRPKFRRLPNGAVSTYTPGKTVDFERLIRGAAIDAMDGMKPFLGPLGMRVLLVFPIPASRPKWWRLLAAEKTAPHISRPDTSNCLKAIEDSMNGVVWNDDAQVCETSIKKVYGANVGITVEMYAVTDLEKP